MTGGGYVLVGLAEGGWMKAAMEISRLVQQSLVLILSATLAGLLEVLETILESIILQRSVCLMVAEAAWSCAWVQKWAASRRLSLKEAHPLGVRLPNGRLECRQAAGGTFCARDCAIRVRISSG